MFFNFIQILVFINLFNTYFIKRYVISKAQYFMLHFFFNMWICYVTYQEALYCFFNPMNAFEIAYSSSGILTTTGIASFHFHHIIDSYKTLKREDWVHHLGSSIIVPIIGLTNPFGRVISLSNFVMCGLPGGIDYLLLSLVKYCYIDKMTEKRINRWLNLLIRMPGQMLSYYILIVNYYHGMVEWYSFMFIAMFFHTLNSIYYCNKVVGNYHVCEYEIKKNISKNKQN